MSRLVYGVGINDRKYPANINGMPKKEYITWLQMLMRCYSEKYKKTRPTYEGCTVSDSFKSYSYFYEWCQDQKGFNTPGFQIDKDLIFKGNKLYSEDTCFFVPVEINSAIITCGSRRGNNPVGVYFDKSLKSYIAKYSRDGKQVILGRFDDSYSAFMEYKKAKELHYKYLAEKYNKEIEGVVFEALMSRKVDIFD